MINLLAGKIITITGSALSSGTAWWVKSGVDPVRIGAVNSTPLILGPYINDSDIDVVMTEGIYSYFFNGDGDQVPTPLMNQVFNPNDGLVQIENSTIFGDAGTEGYGINIGGVNYESTFKVSDIDGTNFAQTILHRHSTLLEPLILFARTNADTASHIAVTAGQGLGSIFAAGYAGNNYKLFGYAQFAVDAGTISETSAPGKYSIFVTPDGSVVPVAAFIINNDRTVTARIKPRIKSEASAASPTFNTNDYDIYEASAQTAAIDFANANITGTPTNGQILILIIASSTTSARVITYGTNFVSSTIVLPTTTTASTAPITITLQYHSNYAGGAKWVCKGVA